ncbi:MAG: hypothetical protein A2785_01265 [Candidatus Chisholmbacteria bacterium RIFCSPHIGHO2_01_FULL_49_18]|uniref:Uncharacterized protein n=2 Tax=Candidatus Chisholmiibacteriota TaxID=1817900 RepID=A0A1G1VLB4_9BACT|nr:MAG: hypothetical protein A2785_01265 [Candidatus Chisholmbacteria bacterium RIFCSPHIGHO2_01_FULL_49_18]OGY21824.1 MAG: hypothetical protein A3A65_02555 [Candidatus Chisholmbacteria bacterium RIFCSPLOWO2_01_FULL_49_14]
MNAETDHVENSDGLERHKKAIGNVNRSFDTPFWRLYGQIMESSHRVLARTYHNSLRRSEIGLADQELRTQYGEAHDHFLQESQEGFELIRQYAPVNDAGKALLIRQRVFQTVDEFLMIAKKEMVAHPDRIKQVRLTARKLLLEGAKSAQETESGIYDWRGISELASLVHQGNVEDEKLGEGLQRFLEIPEDVRFDVRGLE